MVTILPHPPCKKICRKTVLCRYLNLLKNIPIYANFLKKKKKIKRYQISQVKLNIERI